MTEVKEELSGTQKVAVVLMNMNHDRAAQVMKQFSEAEADEIAAEIVRLRSVDSATASKALDEFHEMTVQGQWRPRGGRDRVPAHGERLRRADGPDRDADVPL